MKSLALAHHGRSFRELLAHSDCSKLPKTDGGVGA